MAAPTPPEQKKTTAMPRPERGDGDTAAGESPTPPTGGSPAQKHQKDGSVRLDPFLRERQFQDLVAIFSFAPPPVSDVVAEALVVFDANALLLPYKANKIAFESVKNVLTRLSVEKRLLIPARAAREFAVHRLGKIAELYVTAKDWLKSINNTTPEQRNICALGLIPEVDALKENIKVANKALGQCRDILPVVLQKLRGWYSTDPILSFYRSVVGVENLCESKLSREELLKDNLDRNLNQCPPGSSKEDAGKPDQGIGDKMIWHAMLENARATRRNVIFVTQDVTKKDWVHYNEESQAVLFPRYELAEEFRRETGGNSLYIVDLATLLELFHEGEAAVRSVKAAEAVLDVDQEITSRDILDLARIQHLVRRSGHSFRFLRNFGINLDDDGFKRLLRLFPETLRPCTIKSYDTDGRRLPGKPGLRRR